MSESDLLAALGGAAVSFEVGGVTFELRPLKFSDAREYRAFKQDNPDDPIGAVMKLVALSATGPGGLALSDELVGKLPASVVEKLALRCNELNGWGDAAKN